MIDPHKTMRVKGSTYKRIDKDARANFLKNSKELKPTFDDIFNYLMDKAGVKK